jgi:hypothetical protein
LEAEVRDVSRHRGRYGRTVGIIMQTEYILYGLPSGETRDYMESIIWVTKDSTQIDRVREIASGEGWHSFRIDTYTGKAPNFKRALKI